MLKIALLHLAIANPASTYCVEQGGVLKKTPESETYVCILPDGTICEEWAFFRGECQQRQRIGNG